MKTYLFNIVLIVCSFFVSCNSSTSSTQIKQINYGTSFGFCVGYCKNEMTLKSSLVTYHKESWDNYLKPIICSEKLENEEWNKIKDFSNIDSFFELDEVIGCPDCADGGKEWLEIILINGDKHKVIFEYSNEPEIIKEYIITLRNQMKDAEECK